MPRGLRDIRRKIKSIKSTRQVTKAMELISAAKMRKAVQNAQQLRMYANASWKILQRVAAANPDLDIALEQRPPKKILAILFTSDKGLTGGLNAKLFRTVTQYLKQEKELPTFESIDFIVMGKRGQQFLARTGQNIIGAFPVPSTGISVKDVRAVVRMASEAFTNKTHDHVVLIYSDFISALVQEPTVKVLLPFSDSTLKEMLASMLPASKRIEPEHESDSKKKTQYLFEPSAEVVLQGIIPLITEVQVYQALLEAVASEHSARMVAMRSASDNASAFIDDLTLTYNQTRQAAITAELAELSASKAALE